MKSDDRQTGKIARSMTNARFATKHRLNISALMPAGHGQKPDDASCRMYFIDKKKMYLTGSAGVGKSYLVSAIGQQACTLGYRVMYFNVSKLFSKLKMAKADGSCISEIAKIERQHLVILDDFGIQSLDAQSRSMLMEIIEDRHEKGSTIITSQVPVPKWHEVIAEQTIADAIMDRLIHNAHRIELRGESQEKSQILN